MTAYETERWPFIPARSFKRVPIASSRRFVRLVCIHDMEYPEKMTAAEDVARWFQKEAKTSAHVCVDADSIIQCVHDNDIAWAAPGANSDGIHIELAGYGRQTRDEWLDEYSLALLHKGADAAAQYCLKYGLPPVHLTNDELQRGRPGIVGHYQVSAVYKQSDHTDPGPNFPWDAFMSFVQTWIDVRR